MSDSNWGGVFAAITTPFRDDEALDLEALERHVAALLDAGVEGLIVLGAAGENASLSGGEKLRVVDCALAAAARRAPVLAGVAETTTSAACHFAVECERRGADGVAVLPSPAYGSDRRETLLHHRSVAGATALPVMVAHDRRDITPAMMLELAELDNVVAVAAGAGQLGALIDAGFAVFAGSDALLVEGVARGARGCVSALANAFPREIVELHALALAGRRAQARELEQWFAPLLRLGDGETLVQGIKLAQRLAGRGAETVRAPRLPLSGEERARAERLVTAALATGAGVGT